MNKDEKEKWNQVVGRAKKAWTGLTDDDFKKADGSTDKLSTLIHNRYGDSQDVIATKLSGSVKPQPPTP